MSIPPFNNWIIIFSGQAQRFGVCEHDKILTINGKTPRNVDDAVGVIKQVQNSFVFYLGQFKLLKRMSYFTGNVFTLSFSPTRLAIK